MCLLACCPLFPRGGVRGAVVCLPPVFGGVGRSPPSGLACRQRCGGRREARGSPVVSTFIFCRWLRSSGAVESRLWRWVPRPPGAQGKAMAARGARSSGGSGAAGGRRWAPGRGPPWWPYWNLMRSSPMRAWGRMLGIHSMMKGVGSFCVGEVFPGGGEIQSVGSPSKGGPRFVWLWGWVFSGSEEGVLPSVERVSVCGGLCFPRPPPVCWGPLSSAEPISSV